MIISAKRRHYFSARSITLNLINDSQNTVDNIKLPRRPTVQTPAQAKVTVAPEFCLNAVHRRLTEYSHNCIRNFSEYCHCGL